MNRDGKEKKITVFFCILLTYSTPLALCAQGTHVRKCKRKRGFLLYFTHLFVPLHTNLDHVYDGLQDFWKVFAP